MHYAFVMFLDKEVRKSDKAAPHTEVISIG
jgi:hypothetical protein